MSVDSTAGAASTGMYGTVRRIAELTGGTIHGEGDTAVTGVSDVKEARPGDLVFAESAKYLAAALQSSCAAVLTSSDIVPADRPATPALILVPDPRTAFVQVLEALAPPESLPAGIHPSAIIDPEATLGAGVRIGPLVSVGPGCRIGDGVMIYAGAHVGANCRIGDGSILNAGVVLYDRVVVGKRCRLHSGAVIGADGFGYVPVGFGLRKVPQLGTVELEDDVEIGANTCVDRAKTGVTLLGAGTKVDNLCQIGHNCRLGKMCIIISQTGMSGGITMGDGVIVGGQAGLQGHITVGDGARVGGQAGVLGDVAAGVTVSGYPAREHRRKMREYAASAQMPEALKRLKAAEKRIAELEAKLAGSETEHGS